MKIGNGDPNFKIHIREYTPDDREACLSIFNSNHDALLEPPEVMAEFLEQGTSWFLVAELEGKVAACGGLEISGDTNAARLMFGMVDRERQRMGIGTLLMLTRLTLAPEDEPTALVTLQSLLGTESFFNRFGFERVRPDERRHPETGVPYVDMGLWLTAEQRQEIRGMLAACPVTFADGILTPA
jgi:N-acetylglutamate synthase-like GNAT family acetyltransferase